MLNLQLDKKQLFLIGGVAECAYCTLKLNRFERTLATLAKVKKQLMSNPESIEELEAQRERFHKLASERQVTLPDEETLREKLPRAYPRNHVIDRRMREEFLPKIYKLGGETFVLGRLAGEIYSATKKYLEERGQSIVSSDGISVLFHLAPEFLNEVVDEEEKQVVVHVLGDVAYTSTHAYLPEE